MKNGNTLLKSITVLCLMLMLAWSAAGCANTAGFVSQTDDENDVAASVEVPELEPNADDAQATDDTQTTDDTQATDDARVADDTETADTEAADAEEISIKDIGSVAIGQTENAEAGTGFRDTLAYMAKDTAVKNNKFTGNTTLGVVITNASFSKSQLCKIAGMTHDGYARSIRPVHTTADGDSIYAVSVGNVEADQDLVGSLSAMVMSEAINRAVYSADSAYGFKAAKDLNN